MAIRAAAIFLIFSVLVLLFVPAGAGSFSAVHGPVTALRANRAARVFYFNLAISAQQMTLPCLGMVTRSDWRDGVQTFQTDPSASTPFFSLRC